MRLKFFNLLQCLAIFCMVALVSCSKDETDEPGFVPDSFTIDGKKYNTLKEAVEAATASGDENTVIKLTSSTSGDGFTVSEGIVNIDFGPYTYYLNAGKAITANSSIIALTGNGGSLKGNGTVLKCEESGLSIEGNLNISGDMDAKSMGYFGFIEDYSGVYSGSVNLNDTYMYVEAEKAVLNIKTLNPVNSTLNVISAKSVNIDNVVKGANKFPVCSAVANVVTVKNGAEVHVHSYGEGVPASCVDPVDMAKECSVCGDIIAYTDENNTQVAPCYAEFLEHTDALAPTETEWGHAEHWQCVFCGKIYADNKAQKPMAAENVMISPKHILNLDDFVYGGARAQTRGPINPEAVGKVVEGITSAIEVIGSIASYIQGDPSAEEVMMDKFLGMDRKLDEILAQLKNVEGQLNSLGNLVSSKFAEMQINERLTKLKKLEGALGNFHDIYNSINENGVEENDELEYILNNWEGTGEGRSVLTQELASNYGSIGTTTSRVDNMWKDVLRTQTTWEHEGYGAREVAIQQDATIMQFSAIMAACYIAFAKHFEGSSSITTDLTALAKEMENYDKAVKAARALMADRASKYVVLNGKGTVEAPDIVFNKNLGDVDAYKTLFDNKANLRFVYKGHNLGCNAYETNIGTHAKFTEELILMLMSKYNTSNPVTALDKSGFKGLYDKPIAISLPERTHTNNGRRGYCGNWYWISKVGYNDDWVEFRGLLKNENTKDGAIWWSEEIMDDCNIKEDTGVFSHWTKRNEDKQGNAKGYYRTATVAQ